MYKGGVIGMGKMGMSHCSILGAHPDIKEIAICDSSRILLSAFKQHSNFSCYTDYRKMIAEKGLDFVVISAPTKFHFEMVMYAMKNNCHIFCEKPFALTIKEGEKMMDLSNQSCKFFRIRGAFCYVIEKHAQTGSNNPHKIIYPHNMIINLIRFVM